MFAWVRAAIEPEPRPAAGRRGDHLAFLALPLLTAAYVATGRLGLLLAVPPGYATAIFPPAGIAVTAMLVAGRRTLPWAFLGSLLLNIWIGFGTGAALPGLLLAAALIAAASTAQAALAGWALNRAIGYPTALDHGGQLLRFLLLSPACCLTSASLSLGGLWAIGVVATGNLATSWAAWWVGDTLGVLIVLPLLLVLLGEPRELWRARLRPVAVPMLLFFALFVAIFMRLSAWEDDERLLEFRLVSQQAVDKIRTRLEAQEIFLAQLERTFSRAAQISRADFAALVRPQLERFPMLQAVEWAPRVDGAARVAFEAAQQGEAAGFAIREIDPAGQPRRAAERTAYYPVTYIEPSRGNEIALGLDLTGNPERQAAVAKATETGALSITGPIRLIQERAAQTGLLLVFPLREDGRPGVLLVVLRVGAFIEAVLAGTEQTLQMRLLDARQRTLHDGFDGASRERVYRQEFAVGQRRFTVETAPTARYLAQRRGWQSWALLSVGVLGTGLLGALLLLSTGYAHRISSQVAERTEDLAAANRQLRIEIEERHNAEAALRQAQRMEAIGRLTGGVAHDFNNLLTVVGANAELLRGEPLGESAQRRTAAIMRAAERGARLTRQLLAFSRRQVLHPETVDLRQRAGELAELLARALREDIEMTFEMPEGLWPVASDPAEFDLAVLNIAVNARDAMPAGGRFEVTARNLPIAPGDPAGEGLVGDFVAVTFADTGCGMSADVVAHAFDPYFTTKDVGAGAGLGLSQVYGFARQSGGAVSLASDPGRGTSLTLFLPRTQADAAATAPAPWHQEAGRDIAS